MKGRKRSKEGNVGGSASGEKRGLWGGRSELKCISPRVKLGKVPREKIGGPKKSGGKEQK